MSVRCATFLCSLLLGLVSVTASSPLDNAYPELPAASPVADGWCNTDSITAEIEALPHNDITGIWSIPSNGSLIAITPGRGDTYNLTYLTPALHAIRPGTLFGILAPTARPGHYRASLYTDRERRTLTSPASFDAKLSDDRHLIFDEHKAKLKVSVYPRLTSLFGIRLSVNTPDARDSGLVRVYPVDTKTPPSTPIYL